MIDLAEEFTKRLEGIQNIDFNEHKLKSMFTSISDDVRTLLFESDEESNLNPKPNLVIISLVILDEDNPCGVCKEAVEQLLKWSVEYGSVGDGKARVVIVGELDDKKIWNKIGASHDYAPRHYIFDKNFRLYDVVDGVITGSYIDTFYGKLINDKI